MKKNSQRQKKGKSPKKVSYTAQEKDSVEKNGKLAPEKQSKQKLSRSTAKKTVEKKSGAEFPVFKYIKKARQFLKESRMELKKVKWPTRKELLVSTGVVLVLSLFVAFFLGIVDFGLIKIIKTIVG